MVKTFQLFAPPNSFIESMPFFLLPDDGASFFLLFFHLTFSEWDICVKFWRNFLPKKRFWDGASISYLLLAFPLFVFVFSKVF